MGSTLGSTLANAFLVYLKNWIPKRTEYQNFPFDFKPHYN